MTIPAEGYSFDLPEQYRGLVGVRKRGARRDLILLREEDPCRSGLLASLKCRKRRIPEPDEYTEFLGTLRGDDGTVRFLYAAYGREGAVGEENEDLYWRLRDRLWQVFESIRPAEGFTFQGA